MDFGELASNVTSSSGGEEKSGIVGRREERRKTGEVLLSLDTGDGLVWREFFDSLLEESRRIVCGARLVALSYALSVSDETLEAPRVEPPSLPRSGGIGTGVF